MTTKIEGGGGVKADEPLKRNIFLRPLFSIGDVKSLTSIQNVDQKTMRTCGLKCNFDDAEQIEAG